MCLLSCDPQIPSEIVNRISVVTHSIKLFILCMFSRDPPDDDAQRGAEEDVCGQTEKGPATDREGDRGQTGRYRHTERQG